MESLERVRPRCYLLISQRTELVDGGCYYIVTKKQYSRLLMSKRAEVKINEAVERNRRMSKVDKP